MTNEQDTRYKQMPSPIKQGSNDGERIFDLEPRTEKFSKNVRAFVRSLPRSISNREDVKQLVRCSGSVAANYMEANDALGKKDFQMKVRLARREAKESRLFLRLVWTNDDPSLENTRLSLTKEASELVKISSSILSKISDT